MCILFIALGEHPRHPLILAANRDEEFDRPSAAAHFWSDAPEIYGGRDLQAGGTWLAVNTGGRVAAITNLRVLEQIKESAKSRGELIVQYLQATNLDEFKQNMREQRSEYNPFNLLFGTARQLTVYNSVKDTFTVLDKGFHAISNGPMDDYWPKMSRGVSLLESHVLEHSERELDLERLFSDMRDVTQADDTILPHTGIGQEAEKRLSSIFIPGDTYGTRTTSVLGFSDSGVDFHTQEYGPLAEPAESRSEEISFLV